METALMLRNLYISSFEGDVAMKKLKMILWPLVSLIILLSICSSIANYLMPRRMDYGSTWDRYLLESEDSIDILVFGSSIAYCDFVPAAVYEETGYTSYVMAGPEQTIPLSYYYICEALKTQSPKKIVLELSAMYFDEYQSYTKVNVGYMPWGINRIAATYTASEKEQRTGLMFPLFNYHSRLWELWESDEERPEYSIDLLAGHTFLGKATAIGHSTRDTNSEEINFNKNIEYLSKISKLCEKQGISLELCIFPACNALSDEDSAELEAICEELSYPEFVNYQHILPQLGIDDSADYYDMLHFNSSGAWKFSKYFASAIDISSFTPTEHDSELWANRVEHFKHLAAESGLEINIS